jgi:hypothetical protein
MDDTYDIIKVFNLIYESGHQHWKELLINFTGEQNSSGISQQVISTRGRHLPSKNTLTPLEYTFGLFSKYLSISKLFISPT